MSQTGRLKDIIARLREEGILQVESAADLADRLYLEGVRVQVLLPKRGASRFPDRRDEGLTAWIRTLPCTVAGFLGGPDGCRGRIDPAHLQTRGAGGYDRNNEVPLCRRHHDEQEGHTAEFEAKYGVNLREIAARLTQVYDQMQALT